jgi:GT2 family glycosyltransferase
VDLNESAPAVAVVVLNWNGGEDTLRCLESVVGQEYPDLTAVLADNGSTDGSTENAEARFPGVRILRHGTNLGYCRGNNVAAEGCVREGKTYTLLLNNDAVLEPGAVSELVRAAQRDPRIGILGPKILLADDPQRIWAAGGDLVIRQNVGRLRGKNRPDGPPFDEPRDVGFVPGCAMMIRSDVFREVGYLDPDYFAYLEDVDLCVRARRAGFRVAYVPSARVRHREASSTGGGYTSRRKYLMGRNSVLFLRKHGRVRDWIGFLVGSVLGLPIAFAREAVRGRAGVVAAKARGILRGFLGSSGEER